MNGVGSLGRDTVTPFHKPTAPARSKVVVTRQLETLALRCFELADRVAAGELPFIDAVDLAHDAAVWADLPNAIDRSGLIDSNIAGAPTGQDIVQATIAAAFAAVLPRPV
jgi:hypothetical protein